MPADRADPVALLMAADLAVMPRTWLKVQLCGLPLARGHARSGDAIAISAYLGSGKSFDQAIRAFAERYADQSEQDDAT